MASRPFTPAAGRSMHGIPSDSDHMGKSLLGIRVLEIELTCWIRVMNMFSTIHHGPHSQKKRTMANVYSKSYIASSPQVAANSHTLFSTRFLPFLQTVSK